MKKIFTLTILFSIFACNTENENKNDSNTKPNNDIVNEFLTDIKSLEKIKDENPISLFQKQAEDKASKIVSISKDNIKDVLSTANEYKDFVIITSDHTIVKIKYIKNCKPSGSWGACMPHGNGYVKKGKLISKQDYINNIIGTPDEQERKAYFFN